MNMDTLGKLAAPATAKFRQLQKIVQDIKKNDGGILNKLRRLKSKPIPSVPARDYRDDNREGDDQLSDLDYDQETYENPHEDDNYEPPPSHRSFTATPSASLPRGEYLDSCRNRPSRPPRKPLHSGKASKQLPPEPAQVESDEEDYIDPDQEDNYIQPAENPPANLMLHGGNRNRRDRPSMSPQSPGFYEVPNNQETSLSLPAHSRPCQVPTTQSHSLPPKPSPRANARRTPPPKPVDDDEYEVCDPQDKTADGPPLHPPRPLPREKSPKPPVRPRPDLKPREFESRTLPVVHNDQKPSPKAFTLDLKRPKIPLPHFTSPKPPERGSVSAENGSTDQDKDADVYNKPWYASACDRKAADDALINMNKDGAFMVRKSSGHDSQQPYTLVVFYRGRVYNIPIRFVPNTQQYALGREKRGEEYFRTVSHIIENHQRNPLVLIDSQSNSKDATKLCHPVKP